MINLHDNYLNLLKKCLQKHNPDLIPIIDDVNISEYTDEFYNELREVVGDEFICNGLKNDFEPNAYGLLLENLIDEIGRLFLYKEK